MKTQNSNIDIVALISSLFCAIHCAAIPVIISFSTLSSLKFLTNPYIEWSFIALGIVFVFISLWPSYKKRHHRKKPLVTATLGFIFIALGRLHFTESWEIINTVIGASFVSLSHYFNWKLLKKDHKCQL